MGKYTDMHRRAQGPHERVEKGPEYYFGIALCIAVGLAIVIGPFFDLVVGAM